MVIYLQHKLQGLIVQWGRQFMYSVNMGYKCFAILDKDSSGGEEGGTCSSLGWEHQERLSRRATGLEPTAIVLSVTCELFLSKLKPQVELQCWHPVINTWIWGCRLGAGSLKCLLLLT